MPGQPVVLDSLGGLVCTARPEDLPDGASPRCYDVDFTVGRFFQRAGLENVYSYSGVSFGPNFGTAAVSALPASLPWMNPGNILANDGDYTTCFIAKPTLYGTSSSDLLQVSGFNLTVPSTAPITGFIVSVKGMANRIPEEPFVFVQLMKAGVAVGSVKSVQLTTTATLMTFGSATDTWGADWLYTDVDATTFGVQIYCTSISGATVSLDSCTVDVYGSGSSANFTGIVSADIDAIDQTTLALDATGIVWQEDVTNAPNQLARATLVPQVIPGSYMKGVDADGVAFMAYSDLKQGTSQPMQFNGQWCDRITQVGPGAAPVFTPQTSASDVYPISMIEQPFQRSWSFAYFLQSSGPGSTTAGNTITVYYADSTTSSGDPDIIAAFNSGNAVYLYLTFSGIPVPFGPLTVQLTSVGLASPPGQPRQFYYFTFQTGTSAYTFDSGSGHSGYVVTYQRTLATLTMADAVPGLQVGSSVTISGTGISGYNNVWTISQSINSATMNITETSVASGVATYTYLLTGTSTAPPAAGQIVTITNTTNANGALNLVNATINSATGGTSGSFTVLVSGVANFATASEAGQATTAGTIFAFDPGFAVLGTSTTPIYGASSGGTLIFSANALTFLTAGVKQGTVFFITRNGAVTCPAPPVIFTIPTNTQSLLVTQIPIGPPNVLMRGLAFTESGQNEVKGANFYTYDTPEQFTVNGVRYFASALIVPDNTSTSITVSFPDSVLLASDEIDIQGNNYFNLREIGSPTWIFQYADRMLYGLCQSKIDNFLNLSFDGGYLPGPLPLPTGWQSTGTSLSVGLVASPDFGNSLEVLNLTSGAVGYAILLYQTAYQDAYQVNIIQPNTAYSVRLKGRALNANDQQVTIALQPYQAGNFTTALGSVTFTLQQGNFTIQTAALMPSQQTIPAALQLTLAVESLTANAGVQLDRIEIFPTDHPVDTTTIWASYAGAFESVDRVSGQLGCGGDNQQPTQGAYQILEQLYIEKTSSRCVTEDSPNYEPDGWKVSLSSQGVGAIGPNAFYSEEEFSISANRAGLYLFDGGKPVPVSRELQASGVNGSLWEQVNWSASSTIWCRYSTTKRQLYIGLPMNTPNFWLPNAASSTPTQPNVILMCNFTGCPTAEEFAEGASVHTTIFGDLKHLDMRRKWSLWQIVCPAAEFVTRPEGNPLYLCNGIASGKIYQLTDGSAVGGQNTDDGSPINWLYTTAGFVKPKAGQQIPGLGALRTVWYYFAATMEGVGSVARKFYSNTLGALPQNIYQAPNAVLTYPAQNDQECVLEIGGRSLFVEFSAVGTGGYAEVGPVILDGEVDKNAPHRGVSI